MMWAARNHQQMCKNEVQKLLSPKEAGSHLAAGESSTNGRCNLGFLLGSLLRM
jgi:hypothetical protein